MESLFAGQPYAMPSFTNYTNWLAPTQVAESYGIPIDQDFEQEAQKNPKLQFASDFKRYFNGQEAQHIRPPARNYNEVEITSNALGTFQRNFAPKTAQQNAASAMNASIKNGSLQGKKAVQLVKAALAIASRASEAQLIREKVGLSRGVRESPFKTMDPRAQRLVKELHKFMENDELRDTLWTVGVVDKNGGYRSKEIAALQQDQMQPGRNLASEAMKIVAMGPRNALIRNSVNRQIRFSRIMPPYGHIAGHALMGVQRTARQHKVNNDFKPRASDRFA